MTKQEIQDLKAPAAFLGSGSPVPRDFVLRKLARANPLVQ